MTKTQLQSLRAETKAKVIRAYTLSSKEYDSLPIMERALLAASLDVGMGEAPRGSNWGKYVQKILEWTGIRKPAPWCAAFVYKILISVGIDPGVLPKQGASTLAWVDWAMDNDIDVYTNGRVKRGQLFVWNDHGQGHMGFVTKVTPDGLGIATIEGNTNDDGSREGYEVARKLRSIASVVAGHQYGLFVDMSHAAKKRAWYSW